MFLFKDILLFVFELRAKNTTTHVWAKFSIFFTVNLTPILYLGIPGSTSGTMVSGDFFFFFLREIFKWWNQQQKSTKNVKNMALNHERHICLQHEPYRVLWNLNWEQTHGATHIYSPHLQISWSIDFGVTDTFLSVGKSANSESANKNHPLNI